MEKQWSAGSWDLTGRISSPEGAIISSATFCDIWWMESRYGSIVSCFVKARSSWFPFLFHFPYNSHYPRFHLPRKSSLFSVKPLYPCLSPKTLHKPFFPRLLRVLFVQIAVNPVLIHFCLNPGAEALALCNARI